MADFLSTIVGDPAGGVSADDPFAAILSARSPAEGALVAADMQRKLDDQFILPQIENMRTQSENLGRLAEDAAATLKERETATQTILRAQEKRAAIERLPAPVTRILGMFDQNWDWDHWNEQVRTGKYSATALSERMQSMQTLTGITADSITAQSNALKMQSQLYTERLAQFVNIRMMHEEQLNEKFRQRLQLDEAARSRAHLGLAIGADNRDKELHPLRYRAAQLGIEITESAERRAVAQEGRAIGADERDIELHPLRKKAAQLDIDTTISAEERAAAQEGRAVEATERDKELHPFRVEGAQLDIDNAISAEGRAKAKEERDIELYGYTAQGLEREKLFRRIEDMDDVELAAAVEGDIPGVPKSAALRQTQTRQDAEMALMQSEQAKDKGDFELAEINRARYLTTFSIGKLKDLRLGMGTDQTVDINGVEITVRELDTAITNATVGQVAAAKANIDLSQGNDYLELAQTKFDTTVAVLSPMMRDGIPPPALITKHQLYVKEQQGNLELASRTGEWGPLVEAAKKYVSEIDKFASDQASAYFSADEQPFVRATLEGALPSAKATAQFLGAHLGNPKLPHGRDYVYNGIFAQINAHAQRILTEENISFDTNEDGNIVLPKNSTVKLEDLYMRAAGAANASALFAGDRNKVLWGFAFKNYKGTQLMAGIDTLEMPQFKDPQNGLFNPRQFLVYLQAKYEVDVAAGKIASTTTPTGEVIPPRSYASTVMDFAMGQQMRDMIYMYYMSGMSLTGQAVGDSLHGYNPLQGLNEEIAVVNSNYMTDFQSMKAVAAQAKATLESGTASGGKAGPGVNIFQDSAGAAAVPAVPMPTPMPTPGAFYPDWRQNFPGLQ